MVTGPVSSDWSNIGTCLNPVLSDWNAAGIDAQLKPLYSQITPTMVSVANITSSQMTQIVQSVQVSKPAYQNAQLQSSLQFIAGQSETAIASVLSTLGKGGGMAYYLNSLLTVAPKFAAYLADSGSNVVTNATEEPSPDATCLPCIPGGGSGGWSCEKDGAAILAAGTAFAVLTVMSGGVIGITGVLAASWWGGVAAWGALGTAGWGAGHVISGCSF